jgi:hypothetical protein
MAKTQAAENKLLKIKAELMWAFLDSRNEMSGAYQVDLCNLSKAAVDALAEQGIEAKHKDGKGFFITGKSANYPIEAQLPDGSRLPEGIKVGNGTKATAVIGAYSWTFKNKKGVSPSIKKLVITDLVEFKRDDGDVVSIDDDGSIEDLESDVL